MLYFIVWNLKMGKTIHTKENKRNTGNKRKTDFPKFRERLIELEKKRNGELNPIYTTYYVKKGGVPKMVRLFTQE